MSETEEEQLVKDLLRQKEERILIKSQRIQWNRVKKDAEKYRSHEMFVDEIVLKFNSIKGTELLIEKDIEHNNYVAIISPTDFHWGKRASQYMGGAYNRQVAKQRLFESTASLLKRLSKRGTPEKIFLAMDRDWETLWD